MIKLSLNLSWQAETLAVIGKTRSKLKNGTRMQLFRYKEDRVPTLIISSLFFCDLAVYFYVESVPLVVFWVVLGLLPKACIGAWNHHHQHVNTFLHTLPNRLLETIYTFQTGISTNVWVLHHNLGHHTNYLDQTKDESRWKRQDGSVMGVIEYTLTVALTGYYRTYKVGKNHPKFQKGFFRMGVVAILLLGLLLLHNWVNAVLIFALPMLIGYVTTCWHTYAHHAGLDTDDPYKASHNITHKWYNVCTGNLGYHTAHHLKQGLHWSKLPAYHQKIKDKIPDELICAPCFPFTLLPAE